MLATPNATGRGIPMQFRDVVCGANVQEAMLSRSALQRPVTMPYNGVHYFFCSDLCRREFELNPRRYLTGS